MRLICLLSAVVMLGTLGFVTPASDPAKPVAKEERIEELIALLGRKDFEGRERATEELIKLGVAALPRLQGEYKNLDGEVVRRTRLCIDRIRQRAGANDRTTTLLVGLKSPNMSDRVWAARYLASREEQGRWAIPALLAALDDSDEWAAGEVFAALQCNKADGKEVLPHALKILRNERASEKLRENAAFWLTWIGPGSEVAVPDLLRMLRGNEPRQRGVAVAVLGKVGKDQAGVVDAVLTALKDDNSEVRSKAAGALADLRQSPDRCVAALLKALRKADLPASETDMLVTALGSFGPQAAEAVPAIYDVALRGDAKSADLNRAMWALAAIGPAAEEKLKLLAAHRDPIIAAAAERALRRKESFRGAPPNRP